MTQSQVPFPDDRSRPMRDLGLVFAVALLARAGWGLFRMYRAADATAIEFPDEAQYWQMALSLARGDGLVDDLGFRASRMPLYPAFLSLFAPFANGVVMARVAQWVLSSLAAPMMLALSRNWLSRRGAIMVGLLVAMDPFLVFFSSLLLTESLAITALCLLWWLAGSMLARESDRRGDWLGIAVASIFCIYLRESNLGLVLLLIGLAVLVRRFRGPTGAKAIVGALIVFASLFPWGLRNRVVLGEWCFLTTRAGISLYDGVGPQATGASDLGEIQRTGVAATLNELDWNRHFRDLAYREISHHPQRILHLAGTKMLRMWNPVPNVETYQSGKVRLVAASWCVPIFGLTVVGTILWLVSNPSNRRWVVLFLWLPAIYFSLVHCFYVGSIRYRLPAVPMFMVMACAVFWSGTRESESPRAGDSKTGIDTL